MNISNIQPIAWHKKKPFYDLPYFAFRLFIRTDISVKKLNIFLFKIANTVTWFIFFSHSDFRMWNSFSLIKPFIHLVTG